MWDAARIVLVLTLFQAFAAGMIPSPENEPGFNPVPSPAPLCSRNNLTCNNGTSVPSPAPLCSRNNLTCNNGTYEADLRVACECRDCDRGFFTPSNGSFSECIPCDSGFYSASRGATQCDPWEVQNCPAGFELLQFPNATSDGFCTQCPYTFFQPANGSTKSCGRWSNLDPADCNRELEGPSTDSPSTDGPSTDGPSTDAPSTDAPSTDAPSTDAPSTEAPSTDGSSTVEVFVLAFAEGSTTSDSLCFFCPGGFAMTEDGICNACPAGQFAPESKLLDVQYTCSDCPPTTFSVGAQETCSQWDVLSCLEGFAYTPPSTISDGVCTACGPGYFQPENITQAHNCSACTSGFTDSYGSAICAEWNVSACPAGKYKSVGTSTSDSVCVDCTYGQYQPDHDTYNSSCTPWTYFGYCFDEYSIYIDGSATFDSSCYNCDPGHFYEYVYPESPHNEYGFYSKPGGDGGSYFFESYPVEQCSSCSPGRFAVDGFRYSCDLCSVGRFANGSASSQCTDCDVGFFTAVNGSDLCEPHNVSSCNAGFRFVPGTSVSNALCLECEYGFYQSKDNYTGLVCTKWSIEGCSRLLEGYTFFSSTTHDAVCSNATLFTCDAGLELLDLSVESNGTCAACSNGFFQSDDASQNPCLAWSFPNKSSCPDSQPLHSSGDDRVDSRCDFCPGGQFTNVSSRLCSGCGVGRFSPPSGETGISYACADCDPGRFSREPLASECFLCDEGRFTDGTGRSECSTWQTETCGAGLFLATLPDSTTDGACAPCDPGFFQPDETAAVSSCQTCGDGFFSNTSGTPECLPQLQQVCSNGYFLSQLPTSTNDGICSICPVGFYQGLNSADATECTQCVGSYTNQKGASQCSEWAVPDCPVGQFLQVLPTTVNDGQCRPCEAGFYQPSNGSISTSCLECPSGQFADSQFAAQCRNWEVSGCGFGFFQVSAPSAIGDGICSQCDPGFFQPSEFTTATSCVQCEAGQFAFASGASACVNATVCGVGFSVGTFNNETQNFQCTRCEAGFFQGDLLSTATVCAECELGRFANSRGASVCVDWTAQCDVGFSLSGEGSSIADFECVECEDGFFQALNKSDVGCQPWTVDRCPAGFALQPPTSAYDGLCEECEEGFFQDLADSNLTKCVECELGRFADSRGASVCDDWTAQCDVGFSLSGEGSSISDFECVECEDGFFQALNKSNVGCQPWTVDRCPAGFALRPPTVAHDGWCEECEEGFFQTSNNSSSAECAPWSIDACPAGFKLARGTIAADGICTACPDGRFQPMDDFVDEFCDPWLVESCSSGFALVAPTPSADGRCVECSPGFFQSSLISDATYCEACDEGRFSQAAASSCALETTPTANTTATTTTTTQKLCAAGSYLAQTTGRQVCVDCPAGRFQPVAANTAEECGPWTDPRPCADREALVLGSKVRDASCGSCPPGQLLTTPTTDDSVSVTTAFELTASDLLYCVDCPDVRIAVSSVADANGKLGDTGVCTTCSGLTDFDEAAESGFLAEDGAALVCQVFCDEDAPEGCSPQQSVTIGLRKVNVEDYAPTTASPSNATVSGRRQLVFAEDSDEEQIVYLLASWPGIIRDYLHRTIAAKLGLSAVDLSAQMTLDETNLEMTMDLSIYAPSFGVGVSTNRIRNALTGSGLRLGMTINIVGGPASALTVAALEVTSILLDGAEPEVIPCPVNSVGEGNGGMCQCIEGYTGTITFVADSEYLEYRGECVANEGVWTSTIMTAGSMVAVGSMAAGTTGAAAGVAAGTTGSLTASASAGASIAVISSLQSYALITKVPAIYTRIPTMCTFYRTANWLNLQGIPGFWNTSGPNHTQDVEGGEGMGRRRRRRRSRRRLEEGENLDAVDAVASYFNCTVGSQPLATQGLVSINVTADGESVWTTDESDMGGEETWTEMDGPDIIGDMFSTWFYSVLLLMLVALGHLTMAWLAQCIAQRSSLKSHIECQLETVLVNVLADDIKTREDQAPELEAVLDKAEKMLAKENTNPKSLQVSGLDSPHQQSKDKKTKKGCDICVLFRKALYFALNTLFVRSTDVRPDYESTASVMSCFDWAAVKKARPGSVAYRKARHPLQMQKNASAFAAHFETQVADEAAARQAQEDAAELRKRWSAKWLVTDSDEIADAAPSESVPDLHGKSAARQSPAPTQNEQEVTKTTTQPALHKVSDAHEQQGGDERLESKSHVPAASPASQPQVAAAGRDVQEADVPPPFVDSDDDSSDSVGPPPPAADIEQLQGSDEDSEVESFQPPPDEMAGSAPQSIEEALAVVDSLNPDVLDHDDVSVDSSLDEEYDAVATVDVDRMFRTALRRIVAEFYAAAAQAEHALNEKQRKDNISRAKIRLENFQQVIAKHEAFLRPNALAENAGDGLAAVLVEQLDHAPASSESKTAPRNESKQADAHLGESKTDPDCRPTIGDRVVSLHPEKGYRKGEVGLIVADDHDKTPYRLRFTDGQEVEFYDEKQLRLATPQDAVEPIPDRAADQNNSQNQSATGEIDEAEALRRLMIDQAKMLMLDYSRCPVTANTAEPYTVYYNPLWYIRLMTFLFSSATQIGTISLMLGASSYMAGFLDFSVMINIAVGVGFLFVYGLVFQGLSLYHLLHSVYQRRYVHYDPQTHVWVDTAQHVYHPMWLPLYDRYRDSKEWHAFFYRSVHLLLLFTKAVVTALGATGSSAVSDVENFEDIVANGGWTMNPLTQLYTLLAIEIASLLAFCLARCPFASVVFNVVTPLQQMLLISFYGVVLGYYDSTGSCQVPDNIDSVFQYLSLGATLLPIAGVVLCFFEDLIRASAQQKKWDALGQKRQTELRRSVTMRIDPRGSRLSIKPGARGWNLADAEERGVEMVALNSKREPQDGGTGVDEDAIMQRVERAVAQFEKIAYATIEADAYCRNRTTLRRKATSAQLMEAAASGTLAAVPINETFENDVNELSDLLIYESTKAKQDSGRRRDNVTKEEP